jgi:hypothetical protein
MDETVFTLLVAFVHVAKNSRTCADVVGGIFLKFDIGNFLVRLSVGDILRTLQKDATPLDNLLPQMSVYTTRIISTTTNLYQKWLTAVWCSNYCNMDL